MFPLNRILGGCVFGAAVLMIWLVIPAQTRTVSYGSTTPALFPTLGAMLCGLGGLWLVLGRGVGPSRSAGSVVAAGGIGLLALIALIALFKIGFLTVAPVIVLTLMLLAGQRRPLWLILGGLVAPFVIWAVFALLLERNLP